MHHLLCGGEPIEFRSIAVIIRNIPDHCRLEQDDEDDIPSMRGPNYTGPLLEAPEGTYYLHEGRPDHPLVVKAGKLFYGGMVLLQRVGKTASIEHRALVAFRQLLLMSEKQVHVYQEAMTGNQLYLFKWPGESVPDTYPDRPGFTYLGIADLVSGMVTK